MLKPITKNFLDRSNMEQFDFVFFCDYCNNPKSIGTYKYDDRFEKKMILTKSEKEARAIIYADEHSKAYERANNEARLNFNNCEICQIMICESCSYYLEDGRIVCKSCKEKIRRKNK